MTSIKLLDCTLRDGGYINNWEFNKNHTLEIIKSLANSNVDIIECGYLDPSVKSSENSTRFSSTEDFDRLISPIINELTNNDLFLMIDYKLGLDSDVLPEKEKTNIDGIRLAFHKKVYREALQFSNELILKGYKVCIQPMVTSSYSDEELLDLLKLSNEQDIYAFYIVDSFGTMDKKIIQRLYYLVDHNLKADVNFGIHTHNNKQLAYSNSVNFLKERNDDRILMVDSSVFGMGRGAGNLNTEIMAEYLNTEYGKEYNILPLLQIIDNILASIKQNKDWGYSIEYFVSASKNCHPNYASYLMNKKTLNVETIAKILDTVDVQRRGSFDKEYIESLYFSYISNSERKTTLHHELFQDKNVLLLASGKSVNEYRDRIAAYSNNRNNSLIIALNHIPEIEVDYYFFSNQKRYEANYKKVEESKVIITSNIDTTLNHTSINNQAIFENQQVKNDNVVAVIVQYLINIGIKEVSVAGLDGYSLTSKNQYSYEEYDRILDLKEQTKQNELMMEYLYSIKNSILVHFVTPSIFDKIFKKTVLGVIPARYKSSRFPGKPLAKILGVPMIQRTYERAIQSESLDYLVVATDDEKIQKFCEEKNIPVVMTSEDCLTGTDRVAEVADKLDYDLYVNIQGDEPVIAPEAIDHVVEMYKQYGEEYIAYNLYKEIDDKEELASPTSIKVLVNEDNELMYMSRYPVPFNKSDETLKTNKQVCVYGFTKKALTIFSKQGKTRNERYEDIEILRFLDLNYRVKMKKVDLECIAVDVPEDVEKVEQYIKTRFELTVK